MSQQNGSDAAPDQQLDPGSVGTTYQTESGVTAVVTATMIVGDHHQWSVLTMLNGAWASHSLIGEMTDFDKITVDTSIDFIAVEDSRKIVKMYDATAHTAFLIADEPKKTVESYASYMAGAEPEPTLFDEWNGVVFSLISQVDLHLCDFSTVTDDSMYPEVGVRLSSLDGVHSGLVIDGVMAGGPFLIVKLDNGPHDGKTVALGDHNGPQLWGYSTNVVSDGMMFNSAHVEPDDDFWGGEYVSDLDYTIFTVGERELACEWCGQMLARIDRRETACLTDPTGVSDGQLIVCPDCAELDRALQHRLSLRPENAQ